MPRRRNIIGGIDVSTQLVAVVLLHASDASLHDYNIYEIPSTKRLQGNKAERCRVIIKEDKLAWFVYRATSVYIEQPMGTQIKGVAEVERVVGSVIAAIPEKVAVSLIGPSSWKKANELKGNATKDDVKEKALSLYPALEGQPQDVLDAALIARSLYMESL